MKTLDVISTWIRIVIFSDILKSTGCTCQWPDGLADSTWLDSEKGELLFTSDHVTGYDVTHVVTSSTFDTWDCWIYNETGDILVMRSVDAFAPFFVTFSTTYRCLQLKKITDNSYRYYELSPIQEDMENAERMYVNEASDVTNMAELCSRDLGASGSEFKVMIKSGSESAARVTCPYALLADYTFTYTLSDGSVTCGADDVGTLGMCANTEEVAVTAPSCSRYPLYASSSTSACVDVLEVSGHTYTSLFNGGSTSTDSALFACVGLSADGLSLSVSPLYCRKNQVPTELPVANTGANIGAVLNLTATSAPCPPCPVLTDPFKGNVSKGTDGSVTMATYTCENNASLVGNPTMVCQVQLGAWNGTEPRCSCPFLNDIENGVVTVDEAFLTATYVCDVNYTLTGGVLRTCDKSTYIWSGSEPSCVIEEATGGGAEATSGGTNLLPVVIVFAILTVVFGVGFAVALLYIFKLRKGKHNNKRPENHPPPNFDANHFKSSKTSPRSNGTDDTNSLLAGDGRLHSFQFLSRPPMEHRQHLLTSASSAIPRSSRAPHGHMNLGNFPKGKTQSDISAGNLNLHLIRETTTSSIYSGNPAPWSKHGDNDALESSMDSTIIKSHKKNILPAIIEKKNNSKPLSSPRKHKKESFGRRLKRQNSVGTTHGTELSLKDGQGEVVLGIGHKTYYR